MNQNRSVKDLTQMNCKTQARRMKKMFLYALQNDANSSRNEFKILHFECMSTSKCNFVFKKLLVRNRLRTGGVTGYAVLGMNFFPGIT